LLLGLVVSGRVGEILGAAAAAVVVVGLGKVNWVVD